MLLISVVVYLPELFWIFGHDQNVFAAIGGMLTKGYSLYSSAWDIKPPNIYYTYSIAEILFGRYEVSIRLLDYISTLACVVLVFHLVRVVTERLALPDRTVVLASSLGSFLWATTSLSLGLADTAQTESFAQPFLLSAFLLWLDNERSTRRDIVTGCAIAMAIFFKTTNALFLPVLIVIRYLPDAGESRGRWVSVAKLMIGVGVIAFVQVLILVAAGSLTEFYRITLNVARYHLGTSTVSLLQIFRAMWVYLDLFLVAALIGFVIAKYPKRPLLRQVMPLVLLLLTAVSVVYLQQKGWGYHYLVLLPALVPLVAIGCALLAERILGLTSSRRIALGGLLLAAMALSIVSPSGMRRVRNTKQALAGISDISELRASLSPAGALYAPACTEVLSKVIADETYERDRVFILGHEPGAYWKSDRLPASRYVYTLLLSSPVIRDNDIETLNTEVLRAKPKLIVVQLYDTVDLSGRPLTSMDLLASEQFTPLREEIRSSYELRDTVCGKFLLYRRTGAIEL